MLKITLFGTPTLTIKKNHVSKSISHVVTDRGMALLAYLVTTGIPHDRSTLADLLWYDVSEKQARVNLRYVLYDLRKVIGEYLLVTRRTVAFNRDAPYWLDVEAFSTYIESSAPLQYLDLYEEALSLYQNTFLAGFYVRNAPVFEEWLRTQQDYFQQEVSQGLHQFIAYCTENANYTIGLTASKRLLSIEPWNEEAHRQHMQILAYDGQRTAAMAHYATCRRILANEYGTDPLPETINLYNEIHKNQLITPRNHAKDDNILHGDKQNTVELINPQELDMSAALFSSATVTPQTVQPPSPQQKPVLYNFPSHIDSFIGRQNEARALLEYLNDSRRRLITVTGAGGVGKTYFTQEVSQQWVASSAICDSIYYISLSDSASRHSGDSGYTGGDNAFPPKPSVTQIVSHLAHEIACTLLTANGGGDCNGDCLQYSENAAEKGTESVSARILAHTSAIQSSIGSQKVLIVLDHFEHHTLAANWLVQLLEKIPNLRLLIASRKRLNVSGEQLFALQGLAFPGQQTNNPDSQTDPQQSDAVQLFLYRAKLANWQFVPTEIDFQSIASICRFVDGLPLGIELAAQWLRLFDCATIARRLEENVDFLEGNVPGISIRHQAPRSVFNESWQLLTCKEQKLLMHLASSKESFTFDDVQANGPTSASHLLQLLDYSFVQIGGDGRYQIPRLFHPYITEKM